MEVTRRWHETGLMLDLFCFIRRFLSSLFVCLSFTHSLFIFFICLSLSFLLSFFFSLSLSHTHTIPHTLFIHCLCLSLSLFLSITHSTLTYITRIVCIISIRRFFQRMVSKKNILRLLSMCHRHTIFFGCQFEDRGTFSILV